MFATQTSVRSSPRAAAPALIGPSETSRGFEHRPPQDPWVMVPVDGSRALTLNVSAPWTAAIVNAPRDGYLRDANGIPVCWAKIAGSQLFLRGLQPRKDLPIDLVVAGRSCRVMVSTKAKRTLPIIAHYVEHAPGFRTRMTPALLRDVLGRANAILLHANIHLSLAIEGVLASERIFRPQPGEASPDDLKRRAAATLGHTVTDDEWRTLLAKHAHSLPNPIVTRGVRTEYDPLNVFFVRRYEHKGATGGVRGATDQFGTCLIEDHRDPALWTDTLAHEIVHHLLFLAKVKPDDHHDKTDRANLLYPVHTAKAAARLSRTQIEKINFSMDAFPRQTFDPFA